jgi:Zn ribbon nucleic-acid-binding protein
MERVDRATLEFMAQLLKPGVMIKCPVCSKEFRLSRFFDNDVPRLRKDIVAGVAGIACPKCEAELQIRPWAKRVALVDEPMEPEEDDE